MEHCACLFGTQFDVKFLSFRRLLDEHLLNIGVSFARCSQGDLHVPNSEVFVTNSAEHPPPSFQELLSQLASSTGEGGSGEGAAVPPPDSVAATQAVVKSLQVREQRCSCF